MKLYVTVGVGLETIVSKELQQLGLAVQRVEAGRVRLEGDMDALYRALIHLRCGSRVIREIAFSEVYSEQDLYERVRALDWSQYLPAGRTFRVQFNVHSSLLKNTQFGLYRIKDAICDSVVDRQGQRPNVDRERPDLFVYCYLENRRFSVGLDAAGEPLHMRGYRQAQHPASLREHLAAAMVLQSGWEPSRRLHDPFCGSGTILTEAAMLATGTPPSFWRKRFGVEAWPDFDQARFELFRQEAASKRVPVPGLELSGADSSEEALQMARQNLQAAGFSEKVRLELQPVDQMPALQGAVIVTNPPYGVRLGDKAELAQVYQQFRTRALACKDSRVVVLNASEDFERAFSLRPFKRNRLNNGPLECTLLQYSISS